MLNIFNNLQRSNYLAIKSYGPQYYEDLLEMDVNYRFAGATIDFIAKNLEILMNNQFIAYADEETISRLESWLKINPPYGATLESRRKKLILRWRGGEKLTGAFIKTAVKDYTGCIKEPSVVFKNSLIISAQVDENSIVYLSDLKELIELMKPAHIAFEILLLTITKINIRTMIKHCVYPYTKCGTKPDIATWGAFLDSQVKATSIEKEVVYPHRKTSKDTTEAGLYPNVTTLGQLNRQNIAMAVSESSAAFSYVECGTRECGEEVF